MFRSVSVPKGYIVARDGQTWWAVREDCREALCRLPVTEPERLGALPGAVPHRGRTVHWSVRTELGPLFVRSGRRGGALSSLLGPWYVAFGTTPRPLRELAASVAAREAGVSTPEVLGAAWQPRGGAVYRAWLVMRALPDSVPLSALWDEPMSMSSRRIAVRASANALAVLHRAGFVHPDMNAGNLVLEKRNGGWTAWVVDFDRVRRMPTVSARQRARTLWRLARSVEKHRVAGAPIPWTAAPCFLRAYLQDLSPHERRAVLREMRRVGPWLRIKWRISDRLPWRRSGATGRAERALGRHA